MKPLTGEDAFYLYMETPEQRMHTIGTIVLDPSTAPRGVTIKDLMEKLKQDIPHMPGWRQRLIATPMSLTPPVLVDDPDYDFEDHVRHIALPPPGTLSQLSNTVADIAGTPLNMNRPLWEAWFIEGLEGGKIAWVTKSHHCLADGVSGTSMMSRLYDTEPSPPYNENGTKCAPYKAEKTSTAQITRTALEARRKDKPALTSVVARTAKSLWKRNRIFKQSELANKHVPKLIDSAPRLKFNKPISSTRSVAFGSVSLADLKLIKNHYGVSINDAVLAASSIALRQYLIDTDDLPSEPLLCGVPVSLSLKSGEEAQDRSNEVGNMYVKLPIQIEEGEKLIRAIHESTTQAKKVFDETFENLLFSVLTSLPPRLADGALSLMFNKSIEERMPVKANCIVANIPGPPMPLYMCGARMEASYGMGPITSSMGPNITLMSYKGSMDFCIQACKKQIPNLDPIARGFESAVLQLRDSASIKESVQKGKGSKKKTKPRAKAKR